MEAEGDLLDLEEGVRRGRADLGLITPNDGPRPEPESLIALRQ
jgi:hypothetical protein